MSFRVGTPNYGLPQTEGTDKRDWSDTNQPFLLIDTAIKNAVDTSATASAAAATAQQTADGAVTAAAHAQTDATTAQTLATSASELATTAKGRADSAYTLADNVDEELHTSPDSTPDVTVTGQSNETYGALLYRLYSGIDTTKVTLKTTFSCKFTTGLERIGGVSTRYTSGDTYILTFACPSMGGDTIQDIDVFQIGSQLSRCGTNSVRFNTNALSCTNGTNSNASGVVLSLWY